MNKYEENVYKNIFEYPTKKIVELELKNEELEKENKQLKKELHALRISEEQWLEETLGSDK